MVWGWGWGWDGIFNIPSLTSRRLTHVYQLHLSPLVRVHCIAYIGEEKRREEKRRGEERRTPAFRLDFFQTATHTLPDFGLGWREAV